MPTRARSWSGWLASLVFATLAAAEPAPDFGGQLARALRLDPISLRMVPLKAEAVELPEPVPAGAATLVAVLDGWGGERPLRLVLVQPKWEDPFLYADLDRDGRLAAGERVAPGFNQGGAFRCTVSFALDVPVAGWFGTFPVLVCPPQLDDEAPSPLMGKAMPSGPRLRVSQAAWADGTIDLGGKPLAVQFRLDASQVVPVPDQVRMGLDANGDGQIDRRFGSPEWASAKGQVPVLAAFGHHVSFRSFDPATGRIALRSHPATDYRRIDLRPGSRLPDFELTDLEGKTRRLADYRGKYLLLDFWATWCVPCVEEFPALKEAYGKYRQRGLEVMGVIYRDPAEKAGPLAREHGLPWPQATSESTDDLARNRFGIESVPQVILIDPEGRVVSAGESGQLPLRSPLLERTLDQILPPAVAGR